VSWFKKALGMVAVLGGTGVAGCSGTTQLVGSDGLSVAGASSGGAAMASGTAPAPEPNHELMPLNLSKSDVFEPYKCLPERLPMAATGNADCYVLVATHHADCNCAEAGLSPANAERAGRARNLSQRAGWCDTSYGPCSDLCVCEVDPAAGSSLQECQAEAEPAPGTTGWCYVSATRGAAQSALVDSCPANMPQRLRFFGPITEDREPTLMTQRMVFLGCPRLEPQLALGERCFSEDEYQPDFAGYTAAQVNIEEHASMCESKICIQNHFEGRVSCREGQAEGGGGCLTPGGNIVTVPVAPQLVTRPADVASICSCQCAGSGPGPYCTCPENMQCEHLVEGVIGSAGSYCIPKGTAYDPK